jgi:peptidoglycan hydrolase-like protein with peptidoglycan-binding domain
MTESSAAAAATSTVQVSITLPQLKPDSVPPPEKAATARVQQILNDFAKADNKGRIFDESGVFGPKTKEHLIRFQQKHNISPATGIAGPKTWKALLERWAALRPLPLA